MVRCLHLLRNIRMIAFDLGGKHSDDLPNSGSVSIFIVRITAGHICLTGQVKAKRMELWPGGAGHDTSRAWTLSEPLSPRKGQGGFDSRPGHFQVVLDWARQQPAAANRRGRKDSFTASRRRSGGPCHVDETMDVADGPPDAGF